MKVFGEFYELMEERRGVKERERRSPPHAFLGLIEEKGPFQMRLDDNAL